MCFIVVLKILKIAIQQIISSTQRPKNNKYQLLSQEESVEMDQSVDDFTTFLPAEMLTTWQETITQLEEMFNAVERDPGRRADFRGNSLWKFDLVRMFLAVFKKTKSWNELTFFQTLDDQGKTAANTQAAFLVDAIVAVLQHPPLPPFLEMWRRFRTTINNLNNNTIDGEEAEGHVSTAINQYGRAVMMRIDAVTNAHPGILTGDNDITALFVTNEWYTGRYTNDFQGPESNEDREVSDLIRDLQLRLMNLSARGNEWNKVMFRICFGNVTNACFRKYSKYAIPIPFIPVPIDARYDNGARYRVSQAEHQAAFLTRVAHISNDVSTEMSGLKEKLGDEGFFSHFSTYDNSRPFGTGDQTGATVNDRVRPTSNQWRGTIPHRQPLGDDGEPEPIHPDPAQRPIPQPQPQQPQPQPQPQQQQPPPQPQQAGLAQDGAPIDDGTLATYSRGGNGSLMIRGRSLITMVQNLPQDVLRSDHFVRFGDTNMQPVRVLQRDVRFSDLRVNDGPTARDPMYIITFTRGARRVIFNPVV